MVTVKKQNIVIEYVCCESATTRAPIHVKYAVFSFYAQRPGSGLQLPLCSSEGV